MSFRYPNNVTEGGSWLAKEAVAVASNLLPVVVGGPQATHQLILVRYSEKKHETDFIYSKLARHGAMWADCVATDICGIYKITGKNLGDGIACLQVVRLLLPENYKFEQISWDSGPSQIAYKRTKMGHEYLLKFNIPVANYANIPLSFDRANEQYVIHPEYMPQQPSPMIQPPEFDMHEAQSG